MANTTNLYGAKLDVGQAQKEATINAFFDLLDSSAAGRQAVSTTGGTTTLTGTPAAPQAQNLFLDVSGTLASNATIEIPVAAGTGRNRLYVVKNGTTGAYTLTVKKVGGTGVTVTQGSTALLLYDDSDITRLFEGQTGFGAWATWTPSWTNLSVGNGTVTAKYAQIGKVVFVRLKLVFGSTTSVSGLITVSLPVTSIDYVSFMQLGLASLRDDSVGDTYVGDATFASTTTVYILAKNVSGSYIRTASTSSTVPFTWATSDSIHIQMCYEAA